LFEEAEVSNTMRGYEPSDPASATKAMRNIRATGMKCPLCRRTPKWKYYYAETSAQDDGTRCTLHEIVPIPGPEWEPDHEKVGQLY
jgi:hypothetical protein